MASGAGRASHARTKTRSLVETRGIVMEKLRAVEREGLKTDIPAFAPGDTVRVMVRVREGEKERLQAFEGICIARRGGGINETFTVRKISAGVGVERIFPLNAPLIAEIGLLRKGRVRRAKLYFLRRLAGKAARIREKRGITAASVPGAGTGAGAAGAETAEQSET